MKQAARMKSEYKFSLTNATLGNSEFQNSGIILI